MRPRYEVADIFRRYGKEYKRQHGMTPEQRKVMAAIMACRTSLLGGHSEVCDKCGAIRNWYNSCRNRHCPKCQAMAREEWLEKRKAELLPCGYFHIVFTLPHDLNPLILANRRELLNCLFTAVKQTIFVFAADPQWRLEGKPGILAVLHTWSQTLIDHFHIHCLIPAGVLSFDNRRWLTKGDKFLFRIDSLAKEFKKQYLAMLNSRMATLRTDDNSSGQIEKAAGKTWIVYAKKPFAGPEQVLEYLGRYTHRIAISNHRIKAIENQRVSFTYKDRNEDKTKILSLEAGEFIRRFLLHVLPARFMKIRYYGFLANACKKKSVLLIRSLIGKTIQYHGCIKQSATERMLRLTGVDILLCPYCRQGRMQRSCVLPAWNTG